MELLVNRNPSIENTTISPILVDNELECDLLEDQIREISGVPVSNWKIPGETAIPAGRYKVTITWSPHFSRNLPLINDIEDFSGVRLHPGNKIPDTDGCPLPGHKINGTTIAGSVNAFNKLFEKIENAINAGDEVWITFNNPQILDNKDLKSCSVQKSAA